MITYEWIFNTDYDFSGIGLIKDALTKYFCTPTNLNVFASLGVDGVHFGVLKGHKNPPVYVIDPWSASYVEPISENFEDFLSMLLTLKNANFFTFISGSSKEEFLKICDEDPIPDELPELIYLSKLVYKKYASLEDVYLAVKKIQSNIELKKCLKYSDEFYSVTGME
uniref:Uncharacterized protein n=1 Tax=Eubacterium plexicaudatum ASF492 TaxID=1235802 RepID=N2A0J7_9FIRM